MFEMRVKDPRPFLRPLFLLLVIALLLVPTIAQAQVTIKVNDNVSFRLGTLIQAWADSAQRCHHEKQCEKPLLAQVLLPGRWADLTNGLVLLRDR